VVEVHDLSTRKAKDIRVEAAEVKELATRRHSLDHMEDFCGSFQRRPPQKDAIERVRS
jgi:hypothetical protein